MHAGPPKQPLLHAREVMERPPPSPSSSLIPVAVPTTTFVQTDQATFKELVQRLTGPTSTSTSTSISAIELHQQQQQQQQQHPFYHHQYHSTPPSPTGKPPAGIIKRRPAFKAQGHRAKLTILKPGPVNPILFVAPGVISPSSEVASLSIRDNDRSPSVEINEEAEQMAIRERRFYLHPSPRSRESVSEPELLPLFPLSSPGSSDQS
ncbi:VQ motif-containing protein 31 [Carex littledalei]|uniref:VQ motif-containing protein 31 n=1 Tax=Carex littledalei TaxID=544730 RepID=A0A833QKW5_9POAL|nr:VQ motif-containing protein 31 [Carex littledalei]